MEKHIEDNNREEYQKPSMEVFNISGEQILTIS